MRLNYYDFLRGIAILMVVAIHTGPAYHFESMQGVLVVMVRQVLNCAVPIFFAISGYFLAMKKLETKISDYQEYFVECGNYVRGKRE